MKAVNTILKALLFLILLRAVFGCEIYRFFPTNDMVLEGHVIKTITRAQVNQCWGECVWLPWCFSINVFKTNEMFECELNNSSKKAKPTKMVSRKGCSYQEMKSINPINCQANECKMKEDLGDGWYQYGDAAIKLFKEKKNWTDARSHCQSLGGDLLSITSSHEKDFVNDVLVNQLNLTYLRQDQPDFGKPYIHWKLNGNEPLVKFGGPSGAVKYVYDDQEMALFFNGTKGSYATVPSVPLNPVGATVGLWVKAIPDDTQIYETPLHIRTDQDSKIKIYFNSKMAPEPVRYSARIGGEYAGARGSEYNVWTYVALSWNTTTGLSKLVGRWGKPSTRSITPSPLSITKQDDFFLGTVHPTDHRPYHGLMKHLMLFNSSLGVEEMKTLAYWNDHGAWIGLHNEGHTTIYKWSDNSPVMNDMPLPPGFKTYPTKVKKCVIAGKNGKWVDKYCEMEYPFICEKKPQ